jgi:outer membrane murein-binding lipoprotein Lpp
MHDIKTKALGSTPLLVMAVLSTTLLAGCAGTAPAAKSAAQAPELSGRTVTVQGELTDNGLGCKAVRAADGTMYNLARDIEGTEQGQRIWVEGYVISNDKCPVGISVMPRRAGAIGTAAATAPASSLR